MAPWQITAAVVVVLIAAATVYGFTKLGDPDVSGAGTTPTSSDTSSSPQAKTALWLGDSYTLGTGAANAAQGEACLTSTALGWNCRLDAEGGAGYVYKGSIAGNKPLPARLAETRSAYSDPDVVLVDAGRNDGTLPAAEVRSAASKYLTAVRAAWPNARLVLITPYYMTSTGEFGPLPALYRARAKELHAQVIDPIAEGWISPAKTGSLTIADKVHPTPAGHQWIAQHLAADLRPGS